MIVQELSLIKMNEKVTINYFGQILFSLLNRLSITSRSANELLCGFYLSALPIVTSVFIMNKDIHTLDENFEAMKKFKQGMIYLGKNIYRDDAEVGDGHLEKKNVP